MLRIRTKQRSSDENTIYVDRQRPKARSNSEHRNGQQRNTLFTESTSTLGNVEKAKCGVEPQNKSARNTTRSTTTCTPQRQNTVDRSPGLKIQYVLWRECLFTVYPSIPTRCRARRRGTACHQYTCACRPLHRYTKQNVKHKSIYTQKKTGKGEGSPEVTPAACPRRGRGHCPREGYPRPRSTPVSRHLCDRTSCRSRAHLSTARAACETGLAEGCTGGMRSPCAC